MVKFLIENKASLNNKRGAQGGGHTPLMTAAFSGDDAIVKLLIENGAIVDTEDDEGKTALMYATGMDHIKVVKVLLEYATLLPIEGQTFNRGKIFGYLSRDLEQALTIAYQFEKKECLKFLTDCGDMLQIIASVLRGGEIDKDGYIGTRTPLMYAASFGNVAVIQSLLKIGVDPNKGCTKTGITPLMILCREGYAGAAKVLLEGGADPYQRDKEGLSVFDYAEASGNQDCLDLSAPFFKTGDL